MHARTATTTTLALAALAAVVVPLTGAAHASAVQAIASCKATPATLSKPHTTAALPGGATMRTWDTGPTKNPIDAVRVVAVTIPASSRLQIHLRSTGNLTTSATPATQIAHSPKTIVAINGSVFDPVRGALPQGPALINGRVLKGTPDKTGIVGTTPDGHLTLANLYVTGHVTAKGHSWLINAVNQQTLATSGLTLYTPDWGPQQRPTTGRDILITGGKLTAVRTGTLAGKPVPAGSQVLVGPAAIINTLAALPGGTPITVTTNASITYPTPYKTASLTGALGRGAREVQQGIADPDCTPGSRDELLRPRTAVAWTKNNDLLIVTIQGRDGRNGGATGHQLANYLVQLGAVDAARLDGGSSTTMLVRNSVGSAPAHVDRANPNDWQAAVPTIITADLP